jgi:predicted nucleic acid-binding protein/ribosomal protein S18 acetylase RimI-like enzyme
MRILIDTNILIHLEDNKVINKSFAKFYQLAISNKCDLYYHPACLKDLKRDKDVERQSITLSKLDKYVLMPDPAVPTEEFHQKCGVKKANDEIDNVQLYQIVKNYIDYFITEDKGIQEKAEKLNFKKKVLSIKEGLILLDEKYTLVIPQHPLLKECSIRDIEGEINDNFFDSLRESYSGFNEWFLKCAKENRRCYSLRVDTKLAAILIFHKEKKSDHELPNVNEDALKMCTFKVAETAFGYKLGELFLNKMFDLCIKGGINYLYLTVFPHHAQLIELLTRYGFTRYEYINKNNKEELRMIKSLRKSDYVGSFQSISAHPFYYDDSRINKFVIPIDPKFYDTLFKDGKFRAKTLFDETESSLNEIEGNTFSKAYLCKSKRVTMKEGDLLFFYGSKDIKSIEPVGVLDSVTYTKDIEEIKNLVKRKTVYSDLQLEEFVSSKRNITVLIFRLICYLDKPIKHEEIKTLSSYANNFQTITTLTEKDYNSLKQKKYFDERFIIN